RRPCPVRRHRRSVRPRRADSSEGWEPAVVPAVFLCRRTAMAEQEDLDRVWDILEKTSVGMLPTQVSTQFAQGLRARPLQHRPDRDAGLLHFVVDVHGHKDVEVAANRDVCFIVIEPDEKVYLSITGRASVKHDAGKAAEIWKKTDDVWWKGGPNDPSVR